MRPIQRGNNERTARTLSISRGANCDHFTMNDVSSDLCHSFNCTSYMRAARFSLHGSKYCMNNQVGGSVIFQIDRAIGRNHRRNTSNRNTVRRIQREREGERKRERKTEQTRRRFFNVYSSLLTVNLT